MKNHIRVGDEYIMPEPTEIDDAWKYGNFSVIVSDILDNGLVIVEDQDSDFFTIEASRLINRIDV